MPTSLLNDLYDNITAAAQGVGSDVADYLENPADSAGNTPQGKNRTDMPFMDYMGAVGPQNALFQAPYNSLSNATNSIQEQGGLMNMGADSLMKGVDAASTGITGKPLFRDAPSSNGVVGVAPTAGAAPDETTQGVTPGMSKGEFDLAIANRARAEAHTLRDAQTRIQGRLNMLGRKHDITDHSADGTSGEMSANDPKTGQRFVSDDKGNVYRGDGTMLGSAATGKPGDANYVPDSGDLRNGSFSKSGPSIASYAPAGMDPKAIVKAYGVTPEVAKLAAATAAAKDPKIQAGLQIIAGAMPQKMNKQQRIASYLKDGMGKDPVFAVPMIKARMRNDPDITEEDINKIFPPRK